MSQTWERIAAVLTFAESDPIIGLTVRKSVDGPERQLLLSVLAGLIAALDDGRQRVAVFHEPAVESGYPDVVITVYDPCRFESWTARRSALSVVDVKVLHHLHLGGPRDVASIEFELGMNRRMVLETLESLAESALIRRRGGRWVPMTLSQTFGIRRLIAVEAKIGDCRGVVKQAVRNRWFASESYVLIPAGNRSVGVLDRATDFGIGVFTCDGADVTHVAPSAKLPLPGCYASWLFNEWIGRAIRTGY